MALLLELAVAGALMGTIIGAGFASGQELVQFFLTLGPWAPAAVVLMTCLLMTGSFIVRHLALKWRTASYRDFMFMLLGNWYRPADAAITAFLFGGLAIMLAGAGAVARQHFGCSPLAGILACGGLAFLGSLGRGRGILLLNSLLVPVMLGIMVLIIGLDWAPVTGPLTTITAGPLVGGNWILNAALYVTYNMVGVMVLLASLPGSRGGTAGAALGGFLLGLLVLLLVQALGRLPQESLMTELPMLALVKSRHPELEGAYALSLWLAMVTTAASNLFGLGERLGGLYRLPLPAAIPVLIIALPVAGCGFSRLVGLIYPFFGYLGLVLLIFVLVRELMY